MTAAVYVQIEEPFLTRVDSEWLKNVAEITLENEGYSNGELALLVTGLETVRALNKTYLGIDAPTDVLAFGGESPDFVTAPMASPYLGDVVIAYPQARQQALAAGHPVEAELALLVVHGVLHLLGYDHANPEDRALMWARQGAILARLGLAHIQPA
ncbi:MAG: rRNA maturation RNase YbeY [Anaerolineae bacterium]